VSEAVGRDRCEREEAQWTPRIVPDLGVDLSPTRALARAFRILVEADFSENLAGHITWTDREDDSMLVNPWGLWWSEVTASDICRVDADARVLEGRWDVTPAVQIHTELHRARPDARVVIHNHPYWVTVLAALGELPDIFHQTGCLFDEHMVLVDEYDGSIEDRESGARLAAAIGDARVAMLVNHGVIITGETLELAVYRSASFERQCRLAYHVLQSNREPCRIAPSIRSEMQQTLIDRAAEVYWAGAVRQLLRKSPEVLD
jgi:ribulose-5-phosphate 4-epimerase/fuculose-1-phosphate aldolase